MQLGHGDIQLTTNVWTQIKVLQSGTGIGAGIVDLKMEKVIHDAVNAMLTGSKRLNGDEYLCRGVAGLLLSGRRRILEPTARVVFVKLCRSNLLAMSLCVVRID